MSRWSDAFTKHSFQPEWKTLLKLLPELKIDDESILTSVEELARLRKVIKYVEGLLNFLDTELVPIGTWDNFQGQLSSCLQQIREYQQDRNIVHLKNANENADNLLTYVRPWVVSNPVDAVKSLKDALESYHASISEYSDSYRTSGRDLLAELKGKKTSVLRIEEDVTTIKNNISSYEKELFETDGDSKGIKDRIQELFSKVEEEKNKISQFYKEALIGDESNNSIKKKVVDALATIQAEQTKAMKYVESISEEKEDLEELYLKVFGDEDSDNEKTKHGLYEEVNRRIAQLDQFYEDQKLKMDAQFKEIEGLLPGATSAGLSQAFLDMKISFNDPIKNFTRMFYDSLALIIVIAFIAMIDTVGTNGIKFIHYDSIGEFASTLGWKLPVIGAAIWLAAFASKRRSEAQRLQQEYAHKEALAKSYHGFKTQIESLRQEDQAMLRTLMTKAIESLAENASKTLDGNHGDRTPLQELVDTVVPSLGKIKDAVGGKS
ncbi:hypothetical protein [Undibacterium sp.]|uniref:hypothetical protein n=1 Tax=Undibacterium sp. TaxID=1914977 RepID=UPI0037526A6C